MFFSLSGSWHDSSVAVPLMQTVVEKLGPYAFCVDSGFPTKGTLQGKFVGPPKSNAGLLSAEQRQKAKVYVSLRQAAEWGMRALQGSFSRLKSRITSDKRKRFNLILVIVLLHNFRTEKVGFNQIATVFGPDYEQCINFEGHNRIERYFGFL